MKCNPLTLAQTPGAGGPAEGMIGVSRTAIVYFAAIFAFAFVLGICRMTLVGPLLGAMNATIVEMSVVLTASWWTARRLTAGRDFNLRQRAEIGAIAFVLLIIVEIVLAVIMRGQALNQWAASIATPVGLVGLAGQLGFATMPILADLGSIRLDAR